MYYNMNTDFCYVFLDLLTLREVRSRRPAGKGHGLQQCPDKCRILWKGGFGPRMGTSGKTGFGSIVKEELIGGQSPVELNFHISPWMIKTAALH